MGLSASKRVSNSLKNSSEFNSACDSVYNNCLSLSQHAFPGVKPYQLFSAVENLHALLYPSVPLITNWVKSPPTRLQIDKAWKIVSTRRSGGKEGEYVLGENEFKEFAVEVFADAVVDCAEKEMLKRIPVGVLGIAGVGVVVKPGKELIAAAIAAYALGVATSVYVNLA
ncbi:hypothetical protein P3S67_009457 [Capsicum chacoense]|uniref:uncharacterized protein LOC107873868 n=1 Tax=Capsicum annuum TaxID=4072 RepID=UPI001FB0E2AC|nr:uncharacterized protein LOC107873868 [Capsicum annuum]KAF3619526.1 putative LRR and NB-ARC domains-containing disease resistance protein [Capsicum annuum]KAF3641438.1 putative LRR and NB-ARC domains-containing disease resistance protein [Capsicum annuum]